ncbi:MAG: cysteine desulfurase [Myxococcota bacterium]
MTASSIAAAIENATVPSLDVAAVRAQFPALQQEVHPGKALIYLDSAATALKPQSVIDAITASYARNTANVHRGVHALSQRATADYEDAREKVRGFIGAKAVEEVIFCASATAAINLVANSWGAKNLKHGDEILITELEHHANIVPWQLVAERTGAKLVVVPINDRGEVEERAFTEKLSERTAIAAFAHVSNSLGTVLPVKRFTALAHDAGAKVLVDGCQGIVHGDANVRDLDVDFYAFSAHKLYGPTGVGVLYGKEAILDAMPPWLGGGDMIDEVRFDGSTWNDLPYKFEAGTPPIANAIGLGAAVDFVRDLGMDRIQKHEGEVLEYGHDQLGAIDGLNLIGTASQKASVLAFTFDGAHPTDVGTLLDAEGIAVRTGHHCAQPVMAHYGVPATARASLGVYSTKAEIDALVAGLAKARQLFPAT